MDPKGGFFYGRQEEDPYCKFPPLYPRKKVGKAGKPMKKQVAIFDGV